MSAPSLIHFHSSSMAHAPLVRHLQVRRPYERLIRKLLQYPNRPAVVLIHAYRWFQIPVDATSSYWMSSERQQGEFAMYYGLPQLSIKACCYHLMRKGKGEAEL